MSTGAPHHSPPHRTLWEEGHRPGRLVVLASGLVLLGVVLLDRALFTHLSLLFDVVFVLLCVAAALAVRPRDFFAVGVLPPLLMAATMAALAVWSRGTAADPQDGFGQALVTGLAHHAGALVAGYGLTLAVLALRQVAIRNAGAIRSRARTRPTRPSAGVTRGVEEQPVIVRQVAETPLVERPATEPAAAAHPTVDRPAAGSAH